MANQIIASDCINCAACEPECPNSAISDTGETFVIDANLCDECAAFGGVSQCIAVCPVDAIIAAA